MKSLRILVLALIVGLAIPAVSMAQSTTSIQLPGTTITTTTTVPTSTVVTTSVSTTSIGTTSTNTTSGNDSADSNNNTNNNDDSNRRELRCSPNEQSAETGAPAVVRVSGGNGTFSVSAPGYTAVNTSNNRFTFTYRTPGRKSVVVTSGNQNEACVIEVTGTALVSSDTSEAEQVSVDAAQEEEMVESTMVWPWILLAILVAIGIALIARSRRTIA